MYTYKVTNVLVCICYATALVVGVYPEIDSSEFTHVNYFGYITVNFIIVNELKLDIFRK